MYPLDSVGLVLFLSIQMALMLTLVVVDDYGLNEWKRWQEKKKKKKEKTKILRGQSQTHWHTTSNGILKKLYTHIRLINGGTMDLGLMEDFYTYQNATNGWHFNRIWQAIRAVQLPWLGRRNPDPNRCRATVCHESINSREPSWQFTWRHPQRKNKLFCRACTFARQFACGFPRRSNSICVLLIWINPVQWSSLFDYTDNTLSFIKVGSCLNVTSLFT